MRRNNLLATGMLSVLLAASACGAVTGTPGFPGAVQARPEASAMPGLDKSLAEIGVSQRNAAERIAAAKAAADRAATEKPAAGKPDGGDAEAGDSAGEAVGTPDAPAAAQEEAAAAPEGAKGQPGAGVDATIPSTGQSGVPQAPKPAPALPVPSAGQVVTTVHTAAHTWAEASAAGTAAGKTRAPHQAGEGTGTYEDPITIAVSSGPDGQAIPAGTRIYLPDLRRYFIAEDPCGDGEDQCRQGGSATGSTLRMDIRIGGEGVSAAAAEACSRQVADVGAAVLNPAGNYVVAPGAGVMHDGKCNAGYGDALVGK